MSGAVKIEYVLHPIGYHSYPDTSVELNRTTTWTKSVLILDGGSSLDSTTICWKHSPLCGTLTFLAAEILANSLVSSHSTLVLTKVNTYGLVYHWQGSDSGLKPILMAAHQGDTLPSTSILPFL